jgi:predicted lactoylglutathione lyase
VPTMIFVNLPVKDLDKSKQFFTELGFTINQQFTDENASTIVISDTIYLMLLVEPFFKTFTKKDIADATTSTEAIIALSADSRDAVDELVDKAIAAGAGPSNEPMDEGFMYARSFADPNGHLFEVMWMDPKAVQSTT